MAKVSELKAAGVDAVVIYAVNDGAVMNAWSRDYKAEAPYVQFLGDPRSELTKAMNLVLDHPGPMSVLGNPRCKRFSAVIRDGYFRTLNISARPDDPAGDDDPSASLVEKTLADFEEARKKGTPL